MEYLIVVLVVLLALVVGLAIGNWIRSKMSSPPTEGKKKRS